MKTIFDDKQALKTVNDINTHRDSVRKKLMFIASEIQKRADNHDLSKLQKPEIEWLIEMDKEPRYPYGTDEYFDKMKRWQKFFDHHYAINRHHPDHFENGVNDMTLVDVVEYLVDIISYIDELHISQAVDIVDKQKGRFKIDDQLADILKNTLIEYFSNIGNMQSQYNQSNMHSN